MIRELAIDILLKLEKDKSMLLDNALKEVYQIVPSAEDKRLVVNIIRGVIRNRLTLDCIIERLSGKRIKHIEPLVAMAIRISLFQIIYCQRIPEYAATDESVQIAKKVSQRSADFANAIIRKTIELVKKHEKEQPRATLKSLFGEYMFKKITSNQANYLSVLYSHPQWLIQKWIEDYGYEATEKICQANNSTAPVTVRINRLKAQRDWILQELKSRNIEAKPGELPDSIYLWKTGGLVSIDLFRQGYIHAQDETFIRIGYETDVKEGFCVLDMCAAPGGKTTHMAELMNNKGVIIAVDISLDKIKQVIRATQRLGINIVKFVVGDSTRICFKMRFDRIIIDTPCLNTGVLSRKPDARWRVKPRNLKTLNKKQIGFLKNAFSHLKPEGKMIYCTCSLEREENEQIIQEFMKDTPELNLIKSHTFLPSKESCGGYFAVLQKI
jgi:16S rRNA (cytosine967-C5)-methyltransferase